MPTRAPTDTTRRSTRHRSALGVAVLALLLALGALREPGTAAAPSTGDETTDGGNMTGVSTTTTTSEPDMSGGPGAEVLHAEELAGTRELGTSGRDHEDPRGFVIAAGLVASLALAAILNAHRRRARPG